MLITITLCTFVPRASKHPLPDLELQSVRAVFGEKVKELSVALAKVDALTRQLEELKKGNTTNSYQFSTTAVGNAKYNQELDKLRQELLVSAAVCFSSEGMRYCLACENIEEPRYC